MQQGVQLPDLLELFGLEYPFQRQVAQAGAEHVLLTLQNAEVALDRSGVGEDDRQVGHERANIREFATIVVNVAPAGVEAGGVSMLVQFRSEAGVIAVCH